MLNLKNSLGALISINSPTVVDIMSRAGYDWLMIDMEHGPLEIPDVHAMLQAKSDRCKALVRVPEESLTTHLKRILDLGCDGAIVPQIKNAESAQRAMRACFYPPLGERGVGCSRAQGYGVDLASYVASANDQMAVVLQVEHVDALANLDSILVTPNIAGVLVGPYDLSASLGHPGDVGAPPVKAAIETIRARCHAHGVAVGIFTADPQAARAYRRQGFQFVVITIDAMLLWQASRDLLAAVREPEASSIPVAEQAAAACGSLKASRPSREMRPRPQLGAGVQSHPHTPVRRRAAPQRTVDGQTLRCQPVGGAAPRHGYTPAGI